MLGYDRHSETERVWVFFDGISNLKRLKIQSSLVRNLQDISDEMNIHVPQTVQARAEAEEIMLVKHNIISAQANCPVIGLIQDALLGTYLLSGDVFTRANAMQIAQCPTGVTGKEIISTILPDITYERGRVKIVRGVFLEGRLTKRDVGKSNGSLVHIIYNDFGADACVDFIYNLQGLAHRYLQLRGFTIGIGDLVRSKEATDACQQEKKSAFRDAKDLEDPNARLNACRAVMGRTVMKDMGDTNSFYCMVNSGSKGSMVNITQVQACLGQMNVQGGRIPCQWVGRTATEFKRGEHTPTAKGFVSSSYLEGLTPFEMFAHSMSGREGLIDTAIKTAQTGYTERKLMKCLENVISCADGSVRDGQRVIQFMYGEDGFDGTRIETQKVTPLKGAREEDLAVLKESFHSPIPVHRLVKRMRLFGGVGHACGAPLPESLVSNQLLRAFLNVHTPKMIPSVRKRYEQDIKSYLERARICGGEGVGALAAQSIGERTTQCTLNSVDYNEWLLVWGYPKACCIGQLIDEIMAERGYFMNNGAHVAKVKGLWSLTVDELGTVSWKKITHVTRHPPPDGNKLIKITTASGRQLTATKAKSFLVVRDTIEEIAGSDIRVGDKVPLLKLKLEGEYGISHIGGILGAFYAAGTLHGNVAEFPLRLRKYFVTSETCTHSISCTFTDKVRLYSERLCNMFRGVGAFPMLILKASTIACVEFCRAFIEGRQEVDEGYVFVRCEAPMKEGLAMLLNTFDIECRVSGVGIMLDPDNMAKLYKDVKIENGYNAEEIVNIEEVESSHEYVYDLTVEDTKNMCAFNGIACRDTFHFAGMSSKNVTLGIPRLKEILSVTKNPKTPVTTIRDKAALQLKYDVLADHILPNQDDSVESFWVFPDKGIHPGEAEARWGKPTRLTLTPDVDLVNMFEYCAYKMYPDRLVCDVYGEIPKTRGVKGAGWCKWLGNHVETTLQDFSKLAEVCEKMETAYTNDIYKMFKMYGVECARNCVLIELRKILNHYGIYINARHLFVLVDAMTHHGDVTPLTRHGLKRTDASTLKRCTFEEVVTVLNDAALKNVTDPVEGVSACILTGKVAALGSNTVTVLKDHVMEKKYKVDPPVEEGVDMWMPMPFMGVAQAPQAPQSPTYAPNSPTYDPW